MIGIIIQARTGSSRFPRKIYQDINGKYTLQRVLEGCRGSKMANRIVLAMPKYDKGELLKRLDNREFHEVVDNRFRCCFGSSDDLLDRYLQAATENDISLVVRITADCPLTQPDIIDSMLIEYFKNNCNGFMGNNENISPRPYPDGTDVEIFPTWVLAETHRNTTEQRNREHVTPYMFESGRYETISFDNVPPHPIVNTKLQGFSFDTQEDLYLLLELTKYYDKHGDLNKAIKAIK